MAFCKGKLTLNYYNDSSDTEFPQVNVPLIDREFKAEDTQGVQTTVVSIAASASQTINLNGLTTAVGIYLFSSAADINVNMNGLGNILFAYNRPCYFPATITSLVITNTSATLATTVEVVLIKE